LEPDRSGDTNGQSCEGGTLASTSKAPIRIIGSGSESALRLAGDGCDASSVSGLARANFGALPSDTKRLLLDLAEDWQQHGREVFKRVRRESPASYLKVCAMLVPKEMKVEHEAGIKAMTDEQLDAALAALRQLLADRAAAAVDGASDTPALSPPDAIDVKPVKPKDD
jgi:hypothetical protein